MNYEENGKYMNYNINLRNTVQRLGRSQIMDGKSDICRPSINMGKPVQEDFLYRFVQSTMMNIP